MVSGIEVDLWMGHVNRGDKEKKQKRKQEHELVCKGFGFSVLGRGDRRNELARQAFGFADVLLCRAKRGRHKNC